MTSSAGAEYREFIDTLRRVLANPRLAECFMRAESTEAARRKLQISEQMASDIKSVLLALPRQAADDTRDVRGASDELRSESLRSFTSASSFLNTSFNQLQSAFRSSLWMSITVFAIGLAFLIIAGVHSFMNPESAKTTGVVGGIGIIQIAVLFYRNPLRDIGRAVTNAQQARMAIMSYMLGVTLIGESVYHNKSTAEEQKRLADMTELAVKHIQH